MTLVKAIYGLVKPDSGSPTLNEAFAPSEPRAARAAGVAMVSNTFHDDALNVAENIALGMETHRRKRKSQRRCETFPTNMAYLSIRSALSAIFRR